MSTRELISNLRNRASHTGTQTVDDLIEGTVNKLFTAALKTKLDGVATGATANSSDATLLARANHTGSQAISTVTSLQTTLDAKVALAGGTMTGLLKVAMGNSISNVEFFNLEPTDYGTGKPKLYFKKTSTANKWDIGLWDNTNGNGVINFAVDNATGLTVGSNVVWHAGNDGAASSLDAGLFGGQAPSYYRDGTNINAGTVADARLPSSMTGKTFTGAVTLGDGDLADGDIFLTLSGDRPWILRQRGADGTAHLSFENITSKQIWLSSEATWTGAKIVLNPTSTPSITVDGNVVWHAGNDGAASSLDAGLLGGQAPSYYTAITSRLGYTPLNKAGDTMTGSLGLPGYAGSLVQFELGTADAASYSGFNVGFRTWYGLGMLDHTGTCRGYYDARTGTWDTLGGFKINGVSVQTTLNTKLSNAVNNWNTSSEGVERIYFSNQGKTYIRGGGSSNSDIVTFRNSSNVDVITMNTAGTLFGNSGGQLATDGNLYMNWLGDWISNRLGQNVRAGADVAFNHIFAGASDLTNGAIRIKSMATNEIGLNMQIITSQTANPIQVVDTGAATIMRVNTAGNVAGTGAYTTLSDRTTKHDIAVAEDVGLDIIEQMDTYYFKRNGQDVLELGWIAQELQEVFPIAVTKFDDSDPESKLAVQTDPIIALLVNAVKELSGKVKAQSELITALQNS